MLVFSYNKLKYIDCSQEQGDGECKLILTKK